MVHQHRITLLIINLCPGAKTDGLRFHQCRNAVFQPLTDIGIQRTHAQRHGGGRGDDIACMTGLDRAHGHNCRFLWIDISGDDGLQAHHDGGTDHHRIDGVLWHRAVPAVPMQGDVDGIGRAHERAAGKAQLADREAGHVVHGEHRVAGKTLEQPVFHHYPGAAAAFFRRLKY
ncbi:hypothetical protein D3C73_1162040 [compost metagenome]